MNPEDAVQSLDIKPEIDVRGEPSNTTAELSFDDQEVFDENDDKIYDFDAETFTDEEPEDLPEPVPNKRKKRRTELENLEITMKGWNLAKSKYQVLPFTHAISQNNQVPMQTYTGHEEGNMGLSWEGENEDADIEFNFVIKDKDFDDLYLL